jgi:capsular exopolysaccharide synthesis family protein
VIVDLDMRKPKIQNYFKLDHTKTGASLFLSGKSNLNEVIHNTEHKNLDVVLSGPIPPNPLELIQSERFSEFLEGLKLRYDYVLVDNPPIGIVSDAISVLLKSDLNLFVVRADFSKIAFLETASNAKDKQEIKNLYFVLNGMKRSSGSYYKNYSHGYYNDVSSKKKKIFG